MEHPTTQKGLWIGSYLDCFYVQCLQPILYAFDSPCSLAHRLSTNSTTLVNAPAKSSLAAVCAFPLFLTLVGWIQPSHGALDTFSRRLDWKSLDLSLPDSYVNIDGWFNPNDSPLPAIMSLPDGRQFEYWTTCTNYLGWVTLVALIVGWRHRRTYAFGGWFILLLSGMLIAMGPYIRLDGAVILFGEQPIHLPASTIDFLFPLFSITAMHSYRYSAVVCIALAVLAARGMRRWTPVWMLAIALETLIVAPQPYPQYTTTIPQSPTLRRLRDMPDAAVFSFPIAKENLYDLGRVLLAQTIHEKPIHEGGIHRRAGFDATKRDNYVVDGLSRFRITRVL